jgi:trimeric autotransporter adhesin
VPATTTVPAGATTSDFPISTTKGVDQITTIWIHAAYNGLTLNRTFNIVPIAVSTVSLNPSSVITGQSSIASVTLNSPAPSGGLTLQVSSAQSHITYPTNLSISAGASGGTFTVATINGTAAPATVSVAHGGTAPQSATLTINPLQVSNLTISPSSIQEGTTATGTVILNAAAPSGGHAVSLSRTGPVSIPSWVTVPAGATQTTFSITGTSVTSNQTANVTASSGGNSSTASLTVVPAMSLALSPTAVYGGQNATGTITLTSAAPAGGRVVALSSSNPVAAVPASITIPAGATTGSFTITTTAVTADTGTTITAAYGTVSKSAGLTVYTSTSLSRVDLSASAVYAGHSLTGTVTLERAAPPGGTVVALQSSNTGAATVPASVTVPAGAISANFGLNSTAGYPLMTTVWITASYNGQSVSRHVQIHPIQIAGLTISPNEVISGQATTGVVSISGPAPSGGSLVYLSSSEPECVLPPATVTVPAGATSTSFTISTTAGFLGAANVTAGNISSDSGGPTASASLSVVSLRIASFTMTPTTIMQSSTSTGTVTLNGPAYGNGVFVSLSKSGPLSLATGVTVPAGQTSASFTAWSSSLTGLATVWASHNGESFPASVMVTERVQLTVSPNPVRGGATTVLYVKLGEPAPAGGRVVQLSSDDPRVTLASSITIPAGSTDGSTTVYTEYGYMVPSYFVQLTGSDGLGSSSTTLWIDP